MKIDFHYWKWGFWLWVGNRMFHVKYDPDHRPLFSERYGYVKVLKIGNFYFRTKKGSK